MAWRLDHPCQIRSLLATSDWRGGPILGEDLQDVGLVPIGELQGDDIKSGDPELRAIQKGRILIVHEVHCDALNDLTILIHQRLSLQLKIIEGTMGRVEQANAFAVASHLRQTMGAGHETRPTKGNFQGSRTDPNVLDWTIQAGPKEHDGDIDETCDVVWKDRPVDLRELGGQLWGRENIRDRKGATFTTPMMKCLGFSSMAGCQGLISDLGGTGGSRSEGKHSDKAIREQFDEMQPLHAKEWKMTLALRFKQTNEVMKSSCTSTKRISCHGSFDEKVFLTMLDNTGTIWIHTKFTITALMSKVHPHNLLRKWW
jgi:hypothetical protein